MKNAGDRLISALSLPRYRHLKVLNLEFAQDIEDRHFVHLKEMARFALTSYFYVNFRYNAATLVFITEWYLTGKFRVPEPERMSENL